MNDLRYAARMLLKNPGFTAVVALTLALGIGANTTVFGWIEQVLLQPLPGIARPEEILTFETLTASGEFINTSYPDYRDYRDQAKTLAGATVFREFPLAMGDEQETVRVWSELVSGNFFDVLGVRPELGRFFLPEEQAEKPGAEPVAVISHNLWKNRFRGDSGIIGKTIRLNQREFTVIGVAPVEFKGTIAGLYFDVWVPVMMQAQLTRGGEWTESRSNRPLHSLVRLRPGVRKAQAQAEMDTLARQLAQAYPKTNAGIGASLRRLWDAPYGAQSMLLKPLLLLITASGMLLLIICANVGNLVLARATGRRQEIAVRLALGAGRSRIIRQLLVESVLLALLGGGGGLLLSGWIGGALDAFVPRTNLPVALGFTLGGGLFGFAFGCALVTAVLFGLAPAWQATRPDLQETLREGGRGGVGDRRSNRLRASLVVVEVALAFVALTGAGLCLRSFQHARTINPGFNPEGVYLAGLNLASSGYDRAQGLEFYPRLRDRLAALPGVEAVSYSERVPLGFEGGSWEEIEVPGYVPKLTDNMRIYDNVVAPGYFALLRIPLLSGRDFTPRDDDRAPAVAVVNETFARRFLPGAMPIGKHFRDSGDDVTIVGLVADGKYRNLTEGSQPYFYRPFPQAYPPTPAPPSTSGHSFPQKPCWPRSGGKFWPSIRAWRFLTPCP